MPKARALLLLWTAACAPPPGEHDIAEPFRETTTPVPAAAPAAACPLRDWEHVNGIVVGAAPGVIAVKTWHGNCGPGGVVVSYDDGRTFTDVSAQDVLGIADDGTLFLPDAWERCGSVTLLRPDGSTEVIAPPAPDDCISAVAANGPWLAVATSTAIWRTRDRQELWQWRLPDGAPLGLAPELALTEDGGIHVHYRTAGDTDKARDLRAFGRPDRHELLELPWQEDVDPRDLWARPGRDWYYYRDATYALWAANGPLALPLALPGAAPWVDFVFGAAHVRAIAGKELFALEHGIPTLLEAKVPSGLSGWQVDEAGRVLGADDLGVTRWSPETGWQTLFACEDTNSLEP